MPRLVGVGVEGVLVTCVGSYVLVCVGAIKFKLKFMGVGVGGRGNG